MTSRKHYEPCAQTFVQGQNSRHTDRRAAPCDYPGILCVICVFIDYDPPMRLPDDSVRPLTPEEQQVYTVLSGVTQTPTALLASRWREPSLTIHNVQVSGPRSE